MLSIQGVLEQELKWSELNAGVVGLLTLITEREGVGARDLHFELGREEEETVVATGRLGKVLMKEEGI